MVDWPLVRGGIIFVIIVGKIIEWLWYRVFPDDRKK